MLLQILLILKFNKLNHSIGKLSLNFNGHMIKINKHIINKIGDSIGKEIKLNKNAALEL